MNTTATAIAHTLDANHAPVALVLDMYDTLADNGELLFGERNEFLVASTKNLARGLRADLGSINRARIKLGS